MDRVVSLYISECKQREHQKQMTKANTLCHIWEICQKQASHLSIIMGKEGVVVIVLRYRR